MFNPKVFLTNHSSHKGHGFDCRDNYEDFKEQLVIVVRILEMLLL